MISTFGRVPGSPTNMQDLSISVGPGFQPISPRPDPDDEDGDG
jgi:hypothetical protein